MNPNYIIAVCGTMLACIVALVIWDAVDTRIRRRRILRKAHGVIRSHIQLALDGDAKAIAQVIAASEVLNRMEGKP